MKIANLVFLIKKGWILLAMKKRGFGEGYWNGAGGKVKEGESIEEAAVREIQEELGVRILISDLEKVALNLFPDYDLEVHTYFIKKWQGEPKESEEMKPKWFKIAEIPWDQMWDDDKYWLPEVLKGKKIKGDYLFDSQKKVIKSKLEETTF